MVGKRNKNIPIRKKIWMEGVYWDEEFRRRTRVQGEGGYKEMEDTSRVRQKETT